MPATPRLHRSAPTRPRRASRGPGPGYGNYGETALLHINAGDLIAQKLTDNTTGATYLGLRPGQRKGGGQSVGHLWQYALNTVGWEDTYGGGDHYFNDVVVQLDFTSATDTLARVAGVIASGALPAL